MADWYYYNESDEKVGPVRGRELKQLARQGAVTPETRVIDENGRTAFAKSIWVILTKTDKRKDANL